MRQNVNDKNTSAPPQPGNAELRIVAELLLEPGTLEEIMPALRKLVNGSREEPGNCGYEAACDLQKPNRIVFIECWASKKAIEEHNRAPHFLAFQEAVHNRTISNRVLELKPFYNI